MRVIMSVTAVIPWQHYRTSPYILGKTHSHWQSISSISCSSCSWRSVQHIIMLTLLIEVQTAFSTASTTRVPTMSSTMGHYPWPSTPPPPVCTCKVPHTYSGWTNTFLWYTNGPRLSYQRTSAHGEAWRVAEELGLGPTRQSSRHAVAKQTVPSLTADTHMSPTVPQFSSVSDKHVDVSSGCSPRPDSPPTLQICGPDISNQDAAILTMVPPRSEADVTHDLKVTTDTATEAVAVVDHSTDPLTEVLADPSPHLPVDDHGAPTHISNVTGDSEQTHSHAQSDQRVKTKSGNCSKLKGGKKVKKSKKPHKATFKSTSSSTVFPVATMFCYSDCVQRGKADADMIRCSLCMIWVHMACSGEDSNYQGAWTCKNCRTIPSTITMLQTQLSSLVAYVDDVRKNNKDLIKEISLLRTENGNLKQKIANVNDQNSELQKLIQTMSELPSISSAPSGIPLSSCPPPGPPIPHHDATVPPVVTRNRYAALTSLDNSALPSEADTSRPPPMAHRRVVRQQRRRTDKSTPQPVSVTIVGSSIVRGVAPLVHGQDLDASGFVFPGRTARQINAEIRNIPTSDVTVLAAGTNNIETQTTEQCKEEIRQTIENVSRKRNNKTVIISKIPHRHDKPVLNSKIDAVNAYIVREISQRRNWHILDHDLSKTDYKKDGLHFNEIGTAKYALEVRHLVRQITRK